MLLLVFKIEFIGGRIWIQMVYHGGSIDLPKKRPILKLLLEIRVQ